MRLPGATVKPVRPARVPADGARRRRRRVEVDRAASSRPPSSSVPSRPHPYPMMVRDFHGCIAALRQAMEKWGGKPDPTLLKLGVGGGSNAGSLPRVRGR